MTGVSFRASAAAARRDLLRGAALSLLPVLPAPWVARARAARPVRVVFDVFANPPLICGNGTAIGANPGLTIQMLAPLLPATTERAASWLKVWLDNENADAPADQTVAVS
jgi:hypothetical protein